MKAPIIEVDSITRLVELPRDEWPERKPLPQAVTVCVADIEPEPIHWLWPGRIALGKVTLLVGDPGLGKSLLTLGLAATVSVGRRWAVDRTECPRGDVIVLSAEDDVADTIRPRLDAIGADCRRIQAVTMIRDVDADKNPIQRSLSLRRDIAALDCLLKKLPDCRLVIIDPVSAYLDGTQHQVAMVTVTHLNKGGHSNAMYRTTGSLAFVAAARAVFVVVRDKDDQGRRLLLSVKNNLAGDSSGLAYHIETAPNGAPVLSWESDPVAITADEALASAPAERGESRPKLSAAKEWLMEMLKDGPMLVEDIRKETRAAGVAWRTLEDAKVDLAVKSKKGRFSGKWSWVLPQHQGGEDNEDRKDLPVEDCALRSSVEANNGGGFSEGRNCGLRARSSAHSSGDDGDVFPTQFNANERDPVCGSDHGEPAENEPPSGRVSTAGSSARPQFPDAFRDLQVSEIGAVGPLLAGFAQVHVRSLYMTYSTHTALYARSHHYSMYVVFCVMFAALRHLTP